MAGQVLHPLAIHLPIVGGVLWPVFGLWLLLKPAWRDHLPAWRWYGIGQFIILLSSGVAYLTGLNDAHLSSAAMEDILLHLHWAQKYMLISLVSFLIWLVSLFERLAHWRTYTRWMNVILLFVAAGILIWTSHLGGRLVF